MKYETSCFDLAMRYVGVKEIRGEMDNPLIVAMLKLDAPWFDADETPWCSAFANWIAWHLRLSRSKHPAARSWLGVGRPIADYALEPENDIVILRRTLNDPPAEESRQISGEYIRGHVGFFAGWSDALRSKILLLGGNQNNSVCIAPYDSNLIIGLRRLIR